MFADSQVGPTEWGDTVGVGPWPGPWPEDPRYDPDLLREATAAMSSTPSATGAAMRWWRRWMPAAIPLHVAIENFGHDHNIGTVVRTANAFAAAEVHIVGRRRWNRRGAMVTDRYQHLRHHDDIIRLLAHATAAGLTVVAVDNSPGALRLETASPAAALPAAVRAGRSGPDRASPRRGRADRLDRAVRLHPVDQRRGGRRHRHARLDPPARRSRGCLVSGWAGRAPPRPSGRCTPGIFAGSAGCRIPGWDAPGWPGRSAHWHYWWQAHLLDCTLDAYQRAPTHWRRDTIAALVRGVRVRNVTGWVNDYYDDIAWLGLALQRGARVAGLRKPGAEQAIMRRLRFGRGPSGGMRWRVGDDFVNVPATGPAAIFYARRGNLGIATSLVDWILEHLIDPSTGLVFDGARVNPDGSVRAVERAHLQLLPGRTAGRLRRAGHRHWRAALVAAGRRDGARGRRAPHRWRRAARARRRRRWIVQPASSPAT